MPLLLSVLAAALLSGQATVSGQDTVSIYECYREAEANYPLRRQLDLFGSSSSLKTANLGKNYLPSVNINGSASLQSAVTEVAIDLPQGLPELAMPEISKDWYKVTLDINQAIYDGNVTRYQKKVETYNLQADRKAVEVELYKLRDRVNQLYFSIVLLQQNSRLLLLNRERLEARLKETESGIRNGAVLEMNADLLRAELARIAQQVAENETDRAVTVNMLSELTGISMTPGSAFSVPDVSLPGTEYENRRPENELFDIQRSRLDIQRSMITTKWNPKFFAYGQVGYGRPGLNMLDNSFRPWWLFGAKLTWNPWNWNQNKNEKQILSVQSDILRAQQETFDKNLRITSRKELGEIAKYAEMLPQDEGIIELRAKITRTAASQLDNGVITSSDYIARLNEETQARLSLEIHRVQLVRAKLNYLYTQGKL